ncbi:membrane protein [Alsobacter metallidurans]|uniref:Membrane protein n=1 Tax=Alsobacter metallidurans TaxID=340221 RepID=A0A917I8R1_9HYPH|nr:membrane protein [Alsobacter metallidurans]
MILPIGANTENHVLRRTGRLALFLLLALAVLGLGAWGALALWFRAPGPELVRGALAVLWAAALLAILAGLFTVRRRQAAVAFAACAIGLIGWWLTIRPSNTRDWTPDVARTAHGEIVGDRLTVHDVRNFRWRSDTDFDQAWDTRSFDLGKLEGADLFLSYWAGEAIAHAIVSFQFADAPPLAFSIEIRKERGEDYSAIAGFFKSYELAFIAADEQDVVKVRATARGEDVRIYRLDIQKATARTLIERYLAAANRAYAEPEWYNTFTTNCTTVIFGMARVMDPGIPMDWRVLLSGYLPGYLYEHDFLSRKVSLEQLVSAAHIGPRAPGPADDPGFSARIRDGVPTP